MSKKRLKPEKDPDDVLDYTFDFAPLTNGTADGVSDWLASGETISTAVITITAHADTPEDTPTLTLDSQAITDSSTSVTIWLSSGTAGIDYVVACKITTSNATPRVKTRSMIIPVGER